MTANSDQDPDPDPDPHWFAPWIRIRIVVKSWIRALVRSLRCHRGKFFLRARMCWLLLCLCRKFCIFERCLYWIRTQGAAVASRRVTNLAPHLPIEDSCSTLPCVQWTSWRCSWCGGLGGAASGSGWPPPRPLKGSPEDPAADQLQLGIRQNTPDSGQSWSKLLCGSTLIFCGSKSTFVNPNPVFSKKIGSESY